MDILTLLTILHVAICILLTIVVLLQFGKGAEAGAMMGSGSSQAIFTSSAKGNFFTKLTTFLAIAFMVNSVAITTMTSKKSKESIFDDEAPIATQLNSDSETTENTAQETDAKPTAAKTEEAAKEDATATN